MDTLLRHAMAIAVVLFSASNFMYYPLSHVKIKVDVNGERTGNKCKNSMISQKGIY